MGRLLSLLAAPALLSTPARAYRGGVPGRVVQPVGMARPLRAVQPLQRLFMRQETDPEAVACLVDEPAVECALRRQVDGPWADAWARYVLLRPGMSYSELKAATLKRNRLDPRERIPGTYRTLVLTHALCFIAAIPAVLTNDQVFPKLLGLAAISRASANI